MDYQPATSHSRSLLVRLWPWLAVLIVLLFVGFIRVRLLEVPLERDEGEYAYAGQLILQGIPPYELAYNMKLPGTYYAYALGMAVFGQTTAGIHLTLLAVNVLAIIFVFLLGRKLFGVTAGLAACVSYALLSASPMVLGLAAHANHFVVLFALPATWLLWQGFESGARKTFFIGGLFYGLAFLMKQQGICFGLFGLSCLSVHAAQKKILWTRDFALTGLLFALGLILPFALFCLYCRAAGDFGRFWFWTFTYAGTYAARESVPDGARHLFDYLRDTAGVYAGFWILAGAGLALALRGKMFRRQTIFAAGFLMFSFLGTAIGLYFRQHYFILLLPAFAIIVGFAVVSLQRAWPSRAGKFISLLLFTLVIGRDIWLHRGIFFELSPAEVSRVVYSAQNPFVESVAVARYIREHSAANSSLAVVGSEPQIYFYAQRPSATGYIYTYPLMENQPFAAAMQREMSRQIEANKPEFLVLVMYPYSWLTQKNSDTEILSWANSYARESYEKVGLVNTRADGQSVYLWGDAAKKYQGRLEQFFLVYQRKPAAPAN